MLGDFSLRIKLILNITQILRISRFIIMWKISFIKFWMDKQKDFHILLEWKKKIMNENLNVFTSFTTRTSKMQIMRINFKVKTKVNIFCIRDFFIYCSLKGQCKIHVSLTCGNYPLKFEFFYNFHMLIKFGIWISTWKATEFKLNRMIINSFKCKKQQNPRLKNQWMKLQAKVNNNIIYY